MDGMRETFMLMADKRSAVYVMRAKVKVV